MRHLRRISRQAPAVAQLCLGSKILVLAGRVAAAIAVPVSIGKPDEEDL